MLQWVVVAVADYVKMKQWYQRRVRGVEETVDGEITETEISVTKTNETGGKKKKLGKGWWTKNGETKRRRVMVEEKQGVAEAGLVQVGVERDVEEGFVEKASKSRKEREEKEEGGKGQREGKEVEGGSDKGCNEGGDKRTVKMPNNLRNCLQTATIIQEEGREKKEKKGTRKVKTGEMGGVEMGIDRAMVGKKQVADGKSGSDEGEGLGKEVVRVRREVVNEEVGRNTEDQEVRGEEMKKTKREKRRGAKGDVFDYWPHKCKISTCGKAFSTQTSLMEHIKHDHP
eukprot:TRINITY_DN7423_c0_g1_i11.p1 TRINITY_DN7423_c0_g1~~TRINITY_DN7423_c0_g1_i11.p1  ORF type:complete len:285 (+),score=102.24 TRINITY_DN7423_c0_g1_i11:646-1500(+)